MFRQEWYAYDLGGTRTLRRSTTSSGTTITVYAFGLEEHVYSSSGMPQSSTYYYSLGGRLIGELQGTTTQFFLTDALGSVLTTFTTTAGSAAVQGNQVYGPYGTSRYSKGAIGTTKGFTGQYTDATGLDYYNARYYDPVVGQFLPADVVQGNMQGMDPYSYVQGNPETLTDPTGKKVACGPDGCGGGNDGGSPPPPPPHAPGHGPVPAGNGNSSDSNGGSQTRQHPPRLTGDQLANWCSNNTKCLQAILWYQDAVDNQAYLQGIQIGLALIPLFGEDDPDALVKATEEDIAIAALEQQLAEDSQALDDQVSAKLTSPQLSDQVEGQAGAIASIYSKLIKFNYEYGTRGEDGEVDAETPEAIIEAKSGPAAGTLTGLMKSFNNKVINPDGKPFVVYAPNWNANMVQTAYQKLGSLDTGQAVYIVTSQEQLIETLVYLQEGGEPL